MQSPKRTKKKTNREFVDELYAVNPAITVLGCYANNKTKLAVKCNVCGHEWSAVPKDLLQGHGCPKCSYKSRGKRKRKTNEEFVEQLHCLNPLIKPLDKYSTSTTKILVECLSCGNKWSATPHSLLAGSGCPACVRKNAGLANALSALNCKDSASATAKFSESLHDVNSSIVVLGEYRGLRKPIEAKCLHCGNVWLPIAGALLRGNGCPECNRSSTSFVEQYIYYSLRRCCDDETTIINRDREAIGRELDVYIPSHSFAVEYGAWYWHKDRIQADEEKRDECKQKGIRLITIYDSAPATVIITSYNGTCSEPSVMHSGCRHPLRTPAPIPIRRHP